MVEAAGVEPVQGIENTQVTDFEKSQKGKKGQKGKSNVQTLYKIAIRRLGFRSPNGVPLTCEL
jgi:hypothetical protein